jgi:superfamily II DNA/RNA helicase
MLVATDVAARGIDVDNTHVVNYQLLTKKLIITVLVVQVVLVN